MHSTVLRRARPLRSGDTVRLVAPASPFEPQAFESGLERLRQFGLNFLWRPDIRSCTPPWAGPPERRIAEMNEALADCDAAGVWAVRGGGGTLALLSELQVPLRALPPLVIGFSDVTALLTWCEIAAGFVAWHGPGLTQWPRLAPAAQLAAWRRLSGQWDWQEPLFSDLQTLRSGENSGVLRGGNLSILCALTGTPWALTLSGSLLVLEDTHEPLYRIDRLLTQLSLQAGWKRLAGVILGEFDGLSAAENEWLNERILALTASSGCAVAACAPIGHGQRNIPFPIGIRAELLTAEGIVRLRQSPWATPA